MKWRPGSVFWSQLGILALAIVLEIIAFSLLDEAERYSYWGSRGNEMHMGQTGLAFAAAAGAIAIPGFYRLCARARLLPGVLVGGLLYLPILACATAATYRLGQSLTLY